MSDPAAAIYEALTEICATFCQRPEYHSDRLALLTYPQGEWIDVNEVLSPHTALAKRLKGLSLRGVDLNAIHHDTPDATWSLVCFYCGLIDAMPVTVLMLKRAHQQEERH